MNLPMNPSNSPPLQGCRILAAEQYGAGPYGTLQLAALGAEIIKIESPHQGDVSRGVGPFFIEEEETRSSLFYQGLNLNKRSIAIDLKQPAGKEILHALVRTSDGLINNLRGDVATRLGLDYASLCEVNKTLVCAHLSAYGREGPRANWPGYDYVMQAEAGYFALTGEPTAPPARFGLSVVDLQSGVTLAFALLAGILDARRSGRGRDVDVSLYDVALHNLNYVAMWSLNAGHHQERIARSSHFSMTPCQLYPTADGWIYLMCNKEKFWRLLCVAIELPDLADDPRFATFADRLKHRDELTQVLDEVFKTASTRRWLARFRGIVPAAPVYDVGEALEADFPNSSGRIESFHTSSGQQVRAVKAPVHTSHTPAPRIAPSLGEDTDALLGELGYSAGRIAELHSAGTVQ